MNTDQYSKAQLKKYIVKNSLYAKTLPVYTDNGGEITQDYVDFNDLEFIYTQKEDIPDTIRDIKT